MINHCVDIPCKVEGNFDFNLYASDNYLNVLRRYALFKFEIGFSVLLQPFDATGKEYWQIC